MTPKAYRLIYRGSHRETNSTYANPRFRVAIPELFLNNGPNKDCEVVLESFGGYADAADLDDAIVVKLKNQPASNASQSVAAGAYEGGNVLGLANIQHSHAQEVYCCTHYESQYGLTYKTGLFNNGFLEFSLEHINGSAIGEPTSTYQEYVIILCVKVFE